MDIQNPISEQEAKIAAMQADIVRETAVLEGMRRMEAWGIAHRASINAIAHPAKGGTQDQSERGPRSKGRQVGAISKRWRAVLAVVLPQPFFTPNDIVAAVHILEGREIRPVEARRQLEKYGELGFVMEIGGDSFTITPDAVEKFGLLDMNLATLLAPDGPNENEAPSGYPPEPQKPADFGATTPRPAWINPQSGPAS